MKILSPNPILYNQPPLTMPGQQFFLSMGPVPCFNEWTFCVKDVSRAPSRSLALTFIYILKLHQFLWHRIWCILLVILCIFKKNVAEWLLLNVNQVKIFNCTAHVFYSLTNFLSIILSVSGPCWTFVLWVIHFHSTYVKSPTTHFYYFSLKR